MKPDRSSATNQMDTAFGLPQSVCVFNAGGEVVIRQYTVPAGEEAEATHARLNLLWQAEPPGCHYLTPRYTVSSDTTNPEFIHRCWIARIEWNRSLRQFLGTRGRRQEYFSASGLERQLLFWGILLLHGAIQPSARDWLAQHKPPVKKRQQPKRSTKLKEINGRITWML